MGHEEYNRNIFQVLPVYCRIVMTLMLWNIRGLPSVFLIMQNFMSMSVFKSGAKLIIEGVTLFLAFASKTSWSGCVWWPNKQTNDRFLLSQDSFFYNANYLQSTVERNSYTLPNPSAKTSKQNSKCSCLLEDMWHVQLISPLPAYLRYDRLVLVSARYYGITLLHNTF